MKYFDDMTDKCGFGDGGAVPPDAWACRAVYLAALNALAAHKGSAVRAVPFNRPGLHNGCMILFAGAEDAARLAGGGGEGLAEVAPDAGMASAIAQANELDLDSLVVVTARVTPGAVELVAGLGGAGAPATCTTAPRAGFSGFSPSAPAAGADRPARCPHCGGELGEIDVLPSYAIVSHVEAGGRIEYAGYTDVDWDNQRPRHNPARFECMACGRAFVFRASASQFVEVREGRARIAGAVAGWARAARDWAAGAGKALLAAPRGRET
jgi:hypothetical protein